MERYSHWFWNSRPLDKVASMLVFLNSWVWNKQYGKR
jgi:hypothetical protein